jgi:protein-L-isoaspartate(D-aspartate) O-methyltransferase
MDDFSRFVVVMETSWLYHIRIDGWVIIIIMAEKVDAFYLQRQRMVSDQIERRGVKDARVLEAMRHVPRHLFVPPDMHSMAYDDGPMPIGQGQTISQPYIVALMTSLLNLQGHENVLEIGTGSGYQAAVLAYLTETVHSLERIPELASRAQQTLEALEIMNVFIHVGDGSIGWQADAPYHGIIVTAAAPSVPEPLLQQLSENGRLAIPVGPRLSQELQVWTRQGKKFKQENVIPVAFVPLRGECGWKQDEW